MPTNILDQIPANVYGLQAVRIVGGELRTYTAIKAPAGMNGYEWARGAINRISICGIGPDHKADDCLVDFLDEDRNIIGDVTISKAAFEYARRQWKFEWENRAEWSAARCVSTLAIK